MTRPIRTMTTSFALAALVALGAPALVHAQDASPEAQYRQSLMQAFRMHMGGVRTAMGDAAPIGHAEHHAIAFQRMATALANAFPEGSDGPGSRALPAIWENRDDFMDKVSEIQDATARLVTASRSGDSEAIGSALQAVQGTCGSCHQPYRGPAN
ncbi:MAG: cytochrome c [Gemmatimonadota bacterium]